MIAVSSCKTGDKNTADSLGSAIVPYADTNMPVRHVKLLPYWVPSAQFAGYYVGIEKGIFRRHGIDLEMVYFDPQMSILSELKEKKADFTVQWLFNALELKDKGADIVNIAQLSFRSSLMLVAKKNRGISTIKDMEGKKVGAWIGFERQPQSLFSIYNVNVKIIPIGSTNNLFLQDGVDLMTANWFDEYHSLINNGLDENELSKFYFADYGLNFIEDGIYCLEETRRHNPALCSDFVEATLESWDYAFNNASETLRIVEKYAKAQNQPINDSHQEWMLKAYRQLYIRTGRDSINTQLSRKDYESIQQVLLDRGYITKKTSYDKFFMPCPQ